MTTVTTVTKSSYGGLRPACGILYRSVWVLVFHIEIATLTSRSKVIYIYA